MAISLTRRQFLKQLGALVGCSGKGVGTITESAKVREQIRRPDFGHLEIQITVDDPKAYTKPFTVRVNQRLMPDTELMEFACNENEKDVQHLPRK